MEQLTLQYKVHTTQGGYKSTWSIMMMTDQQKGTSAEWARRWDIICLGALTIAAAVTGTAVLLAPGPDLPSDGV